MPKRPELDPPDISPLTEEWFTGTLLPLLPTSMSRKHIRTIIEQTVEALINDDNGQATLWPAGRVRLTLTNQALLGERSASRAVPAAMDGGIVLHENVAGSIIAIDLPYAPLYVEPLA
jgi:hypothetical protein